MELARKGFAFLSDPREKAWWAKHGLCEFRLLLRRRRLGAAVGYLVAAVTGWRIYDLYLRYLVWRYGNGIEREIRGNRMRLDLSDNGISRDLFLYGGRERVGTEIFERELRRLGGENDNDLAVEIGANIGYFALIEMDALGEGAELVAFEPDDGNADLLETNLALNDRLDDASVERAAVGPERGTAELQLSSHSNLNQIRSETVIEDNHDTDETVTVDMWSIDEYLAEHGRAPDSVVAVRMDIEGYETEVLRGMETVLRADGPTVISLEVHANALDYETRAELLDRFDEHGFEIVAALTESITADPFVGRMDVEDLQSLADYERAYNLILKKPA